MDTCKIGIGITTRNRREVFERSYREHLKHLPNGAKIVVMDDASEEPVPYSDRRSGSQRGIAGAKNACMDMLEGCDHIFLFDDDVYPVVPEWWKPYTESGVNHLCLSFELNSKGQRLSNTVFKTGEYGVLDIYNAPNGCMLYARKEVLEKVGGMDPVFGIWSFEHVDWSHRIHSAGLTPHPFMDVRNSLEIFHVSDYYGEVASSVPTTERIDCSERNGELYEGRKGKKIYVEFRE